ncbi:CCA tRNA nucleotidyltransferase [Candidatus Uhrbacteria bacterium]|nr:CCA tRNA nucleotidyltransferase [Candidatus Uhrbacteria bacterium]
MNLKEEISQLLQTCEELSFVESFLNDHPKAELYLVGGAVRDILLKRKMKKMDFDFVIRLVDKEEIEKWFGDRGRIDFVGKTFGVYKFLPNGINLNEHSFVDIALPRTEQSNPQSLGGYKEFEIQSDLKLPIKKDLSRRDFTINAMAVNMRDGKLIDPFKGMKDLDQRIIRAVGKSKDRFNEDLSRMLRAIRFAAELNFTIEEKTLKSVRETIERINETDERGYIVPRETIGSELAKAFTRNPSQALVHLNSTGGLDVFFETDEALLKPIKSLTENNATLVVALLLRNLEKNNVAMKLQLTGLDSLPRESELRIEPTDVLWLIARIQEKLNTQTIITMRASKFETIFMNARGKLFIQALQALNEFSVLNSATERIKKIRGLWKVEDDEPIPPLLSGNDVINAGVSVGPKIRELLDLLRDEQLDGKIFTREQAKEWLLKNC